MIRARLLVAVAVSGLLVSAGAARADVKAQERTQVRFEGMLGRVMGLFGGKAMKEGVVQTVTVKGDRKATLAEDSGTIVDLAEEKVYEVNLRDKSYRVYTFAEMRKRMEEARAKAEEDARKSQARETKRDPNEKEMEVDFHVKETGLKKEVNGYSCRQILTTIGVHEKGKTLEQAGGLLMTVDSWMAPKIAAMQEIRDFDIRYARKLSDIGVLPNAQDLAQAMAMYPGLKAAMAKLQNENVNMDGTAVQTVMSVQTVMTPEQAEQAKKQDDEKATSSPSPAGAIGGMLGRFGRKKADDTKEKPAESSAPKDPNKATFMTSTMDVMNVTPTADAAALTVPAGFKLKQ